MLKKKISMLILYLFLSGAIYNLWTLRPVKILYVNSDGYGTINLVVDHLPWTDRDKIDWYLAHRESINTQYPLLPEVWHRYYITGIGDGFTNYESSPHEDLRCFPAISNEKYCVIKDHLLVVDEDVNEKTRFYVSDAEVEYQLTPEGHIEFVPHPESLME